MMPSENCPDYPFSCNTIGEEKRLNPRLAGKNREQFIDLMNHLNLPNPKKIMEAVPANEECGRVLVTAQ